MAGVLIPPVVQTMNFLIADLTVVLSALTLHVNEMYVYFLKLLVRDRKSVV